MKSLSTVCISFFFGSSPLGFALLLQSVFVVVFLKCLFAMWTDSLILSPGCFPGVGHFPVPGMRACLLMLWQFHCGVLPLGEDSGLWAPRLPVTPSWQPCEVQVLLGWWTPGVVCSLISK